MDILVSSNLERMLYLLSGDSDYVSVLQGKLQNEGCFTVSDTVKNRIKDIFYGGYCDDGKTLKTIYDFYNDFGYICDTHTAVALSVAGEYMSSTQDRRPMLVVSTASPYKFSKSVLSAISKNVPEDDFEAAQVLFDITGLPIPESIAKLRGKEIRFNKVIEKSQLKNAIFGSLGIK